MVEKRLGAPTKMPAERKSVTLHVRVTKAEKAAMSAIAKGKLSAWARNVLLARLRDPSAQV